MKKHLTPFLILGLALFSNLALATGPGSCEFLSYVWQQSLLALFQVDCNPDDQTTYCKCIETKAQDPKGNPMVKALWESKDDIGDHKEKARQDYTSRLLNVYKEMNYGSAYQSALLGMEMPDKLEGCTGQDIAAKFESSLDHHYLKEALGEDFSKPAYDLKACQSNCSETIKSINQDYQKFQMANAQVSGKTMGMTKSFCGAMKDETKALNPNALVKKRDGQEKQKAKYAKAAIQDLEKVRAEVLGLSQYPGLFNSAYLQSIDEAIADFKNTSDLDLAHVDCKYGSILYDQIIDEYNFKQKNIDPRAAEIETIKNKQVMGDIEETIDEFNESLRSQMEKNLEAPAPPDACFTYAQYQTLKGAPNQNLLGKFSLLNENQLSAFLEPPKGILKAQDQDKINFLRSNPLLAKLAADPASRRELSHALKGYAQKVQGKGESEALQGYLDFMKTDVKGIIENNKIKDIHQCQVLATNFAAVYASEELPPLPESHAENENDLSFLSHNILSCKIINNNKTVKTNLEATLDANPLFLISGSDPVSMNLTPDNDPGYKSFNDKHCPDFKKYHDDYVSTQCQDKKDLSKCQEKLFKDKHSDKIREKYFSEKNPTKGQLTDVLEKNHSGSLSKKDHDRVARITDKKYQDEALKKYYAEKIAPTLHEDLLAEVGHEAEYSQEMVENARIVDQGLVPSYGAGASSGPLASASGSTTAERVEPKWSQSEASPSTMVSPPINTQTVAAAASAQDLLPKSSQTSEEKIRQIASTQKELKEKSEEMLASLPQDEQKQFQAKLDRLDNELTDLKNKTSAKSKTLVKASVAPGSSPVIYPESRNLPSAPKLNGQAQLSKQGPGLKDAAYNEALLSTYPNRGLGESAGRTPASTQASLILVKPQAMNDQDLNQASRQVVTQIQVKSKTDFERILTGTPQDLEKFLQQEFSGKAIPESGIISLVAPDSKQEILISVQYDAQSGGYIFRPVSGNAQIERKAKYQSLINTIKNS